MKHTILSLALIIVSLPLTCTSSDDFKRSVSEQAPKSLRIVSFSPDFTSQTPMTCKILDSDLKSMS